jgi:hypothetical protein
MMDTSEITTTMVDIMVTVIQFAMAVLAHMLQIAQAVVITPTPIITTVDVWMVIMVTIVPCHIQ